MIRNLWNRLFGQSAPLLVLRDVFTPGGLPSVTYVDRDHLKLEDKLADVLARGFAFTVVTGPTKSGKSVLCKKVLERGNLVTVDGGQVRSESDFWANISHRLNLPTSKTNASGETESATFGNEASINAAVIQAKGSKSTTKTGSQTTTRLYNHSPILGVIEKLIQSKTSLMVDDFHYIDPQVQRAIIQSLKSAVFEGVAVFLLAVPHRAFDPLTVENEVEGRFKHVPIPNWSLDDLLLIPERGFQALNVEVSRETQRRICQDSFGNPLLVQEICSEFCLQNGVRQRQGQQKKLDETLLETTYQDMAESKGFPTFQKLKMGPEKRRSRQLRVMRHGGEEDIYTALLAAIARLGPRTETRLDDIRSSLKGAISEKASVPSKAETLSALSSMAMVARASAQGEPPLDWVAEEGKLVITDPFLLFYLKWSFRSRRVGVPQVLKIADN